MGPDIGAEDVVDEEVNIPDASARQNAQRVSGSTYAWENSWHNARRRLELLEACYDAITIRHLEALGVGLGWRCLEVGGGAGSVTRWLCDRVGAPGHVVAVDLDTRFLDEIREPNLDVQRLDIAEEPVPGEGYDLVHTRAVLIHVPSRERVIESLLAAVRPGGWLLVEEADDFPVSALTSGVYPEAWHWFVRAANEAGVGVKWARRLPSILGGLDLADVGVGCEVPIYQGGSPTADFFRLTWAQARERTLALGAPAALLDEVDVLLADPACWFPACALVSAWGRRAA
jgi:SAM-dependent methyltransferase